MSRRRDRARGCLLLAALILLACAAFGALRAVAVRAYWERPHLQEVDLHLERYAEAEREGDAALDELRKIVRACNESAVPLDGACASFIEACDGAMADYFRDACGVDVRDRLVALRVMRAEYPPDVAQAVGGSFADDLPDALFLNSELLDAFAEEANSEAPPDIASSEFDARQLRSIYIHEALHYLGLDNSLGCPHLTEALAEALNQEIARHGGLRFENASGYSGTLEYAAQILACEPELVRAALSGAGLNLAERLDEALGGLGAEYDALLGLRQSEGFGIQYGARFRAQFLTYEYCKAVQPDAREALRAFRARDDFLFELKWFLHLY